MAEETIYAFPPGNKKEKNPGGRGTCREKRAPRAFRERNALGVERGETPPRREA